MLITFDYLYCCVCDSNKFVFVQTIYLGGERKKNVAKQCEYFKWKKCVNFLLRAFQIILAGLLLPWLGYFVGWLAAVICRREYEDRLAIAVEAGIQNTGIAIFVLRSALDQPEADLTTVLPVSVAIMTPFPLMAFYLCLKTREW